MKLKQLKAINGELAQRTGQNGTANFKLATAKTSGYMVQIAKHNG